MCEVEVRPSEVRDRITRTMTSHVWSTSTIVPRLKSILLDRFEIAQACIIVLLPARAWVCRERLMPTKTDECKR